MIQTQPGRPAQERLQIPQPFDPIYAEAVAREVIQPLIRYYFRLQTVGLENIPDPRNGRPIIIVANHAGRTFPWDAILLDATVSQYWVDELHIKPADKPRSLVAPLLTKHPLLTPYRLDGWWEAVGCVKATALNFQRQLKRGRHVIIFPEGINGIARDYRHRYQLLPFPTSVVRMAQRYNAHIVPVSIVGSEYFHPLARRVGWLNSIARRLGVPYIHLSPISWLLPLCPWLFYGALPSPTTLVFGAPFEFDRTDRDWQTQSEQLHCHCQQHLDASRLQYERGWDLPGLIKSLRNAPESWWRFLPTAWPHRFVNHAKHTAPHLFGGTPSPWWLFVPFYGWKLRRANITRPPHVARPPKRAPALVPALLKLTLLLLSLFSTQVGRHP